MSLPSYYLVYSHQLLHHSSVVVRTHPQAITLAMITMRKSTHGFPFASHMGMGAKMAVYWVVPEKIRTPPTDGILEFSREGGSKTLEIQVGGELN